MTRNMDIENDEELDQMIVIYPKVQMEVERLLIMSPMMLRTSDVILGQWQWQKPK